MHVTGPVPSSGSNHLLIGAMVAFLGLFLLVAAAIGGFMLLGQGDDDDSTPSVASNTQNGSGAGGTQDGTGGGGTGGAPATDPSAPEIGLTFTGACHPTFNARVMVMPSPQALTVSSAGVTGVNGSIMLDFKDLTGDVTISTRERMNNQVVINVISDNTTFTNIATDSAVYTGRANDPISGRVTVVNFDSSMATMDATFHAVTLQSHDGGICTVNGRLVTHGRSFGY